MAREPLEGFRASTINWCSKAVHPSRVCKGQGKLLVGRFDDIWEAVVTEKKIERKSEKAKKVDAMIYDKREAGSFLIPNSKSWLARSMLLV